ncbi:hypothetical protein, partial [Hymenobacter glacieicola]|uniref:hypothetical protein n=1 Tax=Hymenobacter glacieicola TaxID=1562124 RepID=UPI001E2CBEAE
MQTSNRIINSPKFIYSLTFFIILIIIFSIEFIKNRKLTSLFNALLKNMGSGKIAGECYLDGCFRRLSPA